MKKLLVAVVVACGFAAFANEWYVDPVNGNDAYDGTTSNVVSDTVGPRRTLIGIMELVGNNDTIWMLPGDYAEKSVLDARGADHRRLDIVDKSGLKFRSVAGREKTAIVGQHDGANGYDGENAVGGAMLSGNSANCVFEGITFRDCAASSGGGCRDLTKLCWFIGCSFTNCIAKTGGAMTQGNASGTEFVDCGVAQNSMATYGAGTMEFCLFRPRAATGNYLFQNGGTFINCTVYGAAYAVNSGTNLFYNSLIFGAGNNGAYKADLMWATNSWLGAAKNVNVGENARTNANEFVVRFVSPVTGDFHLTDISEVKELGDAAYLALSPFPEGFVRKDVYGNPVTVTEGPIPAGCAFEVMHQTGGRVGFSSGFEVKELGCKVASGDYVNPITEDYTYMIRPTTANHTFWVSRGTDRYFPLRQKGGWVPIGTNKDPYSTNNFAVTSCGSSYIYYADPVNGNDDYDGKSSNVVDAAANKGPFRTLMGAMTKMNAANKSNKILYLLPGVYAEGQSEGRPVADGIRYRVYGNKDCTRLIVGLEGPEKTFIVGAPDPDKPDGLGTNAIGGVWFASGGGGVQGVTITGCYSSDTENIGYQYAGCAFAGGGSTSTMCFDCIISNNTAYCAPVKSYGTMSRCRILNNHSTIYLCTKGDPVSSSVFAGNEITSTAAKYKYFSDGSTYGCTFDAKVSGTLGANTYYSLVLNLASSGNLNQSCCDPIPLVADPDSFDYRLGSLSPAVLFGDVSARGANTARFLVCDINGDKLEIKDGKMTVGAVHGGPRVPCVAVVGCGTETVEGGEYGTNLVTSTDPITVTASFSRPFLHFEKNGSQVTPFGQIDYTFSPSDELDAATVVKAVYGTNWFVSASAASDATPGSSWETARKTIRSATTNAVAGDVIHVAPGDYGAAEGSELQASAQTRVVVPSGVRLQGEGERYAAVIRGAAASVGDEHGYGLGTDAVRCVYLNKNATIANFMLTEGRTLATSKGFGSAVYAADNTATVADCLVTNNYCYEGTVYNGRYVRCRVIDNTSSYRSVMGRNGIYYGCFFDYCKGDYQNTSERMLCNATSIDFCTIGTHNTGNGGRTNPQLLAPASSGDTQPLIPIRNSVLAGGAVWAASKFYATNCVFTSSYAAFADTNNCIITTAAKMKLSADGVPAADSPLNNAGDVALAPDCVNETDMLGVPRVLNGGVDAGAFEHDWRVEYKNDLGPRATAVTFASPAVVETEDHKVRISFGTLIGKFKLSGGTTMLNFKVQGGTLTVYVGEKRVGEFGAADAKQSVELASDESDEFRLVFEPSAADGYAEIDRLTKGTSGIIFMVR